MGPPILHLVELLQYVGHIPRLSTLHKKIGSKFFHTRQILRRFHHILNVQRVRDIGKLFAKVDHQTRTEVNSNSGYNQSCARVCLFCCLQFQTNRARPLARSHFKRLCLLVWRHRFAIFLRLFH
jgi:hypothetical protein